MAREMTEGELTKVRSDYQASKLFLAIHNPAIVFQCQVNQTFDSLDRVVEVAYDNATGDYADIIPGMTAWVGSSAGAWDLGQVRVRKDATSNTLYVGENADVAWGDNVHLTVVDEFGIWARHPRVTDDAVFMDWDIAYDDQHENCAPVPIFEHQVLWLTGASVSTDIPASDSWCPSDGAKSYLWTSSGGTLTNETTDTVTFEATEAGTYRIGCTVTVGGVSKTGYRYVFVYDADNQPFQFSPRNTPNGSYSRGGWEMGVNISDSTADLSFIRDRALCILFSIDYYDAVEGSIGPVAGSENIICMGWIAGESISVNPVQGTASFDIQGPQAWIGTLEEFIDGIETTAGTPTAWTNITNLTVDKALWHLITWRSTLSTMMSVYLTDDTRQALALQTGNGNLWSQIERNAAAIAAAPCCDRYGRLFVRINPQLIPLADRGDIPVVMELTKKDWQGEINVIRNVVSKNSQIVLSGVKYETGTEGSAFFSLSPGHTFKRFGSTTSVERLLLSSQEQANELAGIMLGWMNHEYDFEIQGAGNNRFIDVTPEQYLAIDITPADNNRGISYNGNIVIREVSLELREKEDFIHPVWVGEQESVAENSTDGDVPDVDDWDSTVEIDIDLPDLPDDTVVVTTDPTIIPTNQPKVVVGYSSNHGVFYTRDFDSEFPTWYLMNEGLPDADKLSIGRMVVTPGGQIYICAGSPTVFDYGWDRVYVADAVGGAWRVLFRGEDIPEPDSIILGIGVNPLGVDSVAIWGGRPYTTPGDYDSSGYLATGSSAGVSVHAPTDVVIIARESEIIRNNTGGWTILGSLHVPGNDEYYIHVTASGVLVDFDVITGGNGGAHNGGAACGTIDKVYQWSISTTNGFVELIGTSQNRLSDFSPGNVYGLSMSPTGTVGIGSDFITLVPYRTTDGGATWEAISDTVPVGSSVWENCKDDYRWIFGGGMTIKLTMDQGDTAPINKASNLTVIAPLVNVTGLRFIE